MGTMAGSSSGKWLTDGERWQYVAGADLTGN